MHRQSACPEIAADCGGISESHAAVAAQVFEQIPHISGNLLHDTHTAILMLEHGVSRIYTRDTDFHHFPFLEPLDPPV
jgi:uncharacterized protein